MDAEERLYTDLTKRINERLIQWAHDSWNLFDMAGLGRRNADFAILLALLWGVAKVRDMGDFSDADMERLVRGIQTEQKRRARDARS